MAVQAHVPVVPIVVSNYNHLYDSKAKRFLSGNVKIKGKSPQTTTIKKERIGCSHVKTIQFFLRSTPPIFRRIPLRSIPWRMKSANRCSLHWKRFLKSPRQVLVPRKPRRANNISILYPLLPSLYFFVPSTTFAHPLILHKPFYPLRLGSFYLYIYYMYTGCQFTLIKNSCIDMCLKCRRVL